MKIRDTSATDAARAPARGARLVRWGLPAVALVIGVFLLVPGFAWMQTEQSYALDKVRIAEVVRGTFEHGVAADGKIVATLEPTVFAPSAGYVTLLVSSGEEVAKDQVLARLDNPDLEASYRQARSQLEKAEAEHERLGLNNALEIERARQGLNLASIRDEAARRKLERLDSAAARQALSLADYEAIVDESRVATAEHESLKVTTRLLIRKLQYDTRANALDVARLRDLVTDLQRQVDELQVRSPIAGVVGAVSVKDRDSVAARQPIVKVVDLSAYGVELEVPESYANHLAAHMPVVITYEGQEHAGELVAVSAEVTNGSIAARAAFLEKPAEQLRQNQRVTLKIVLDRLDDVLMVRRGPFLDSGAGRVAYLVQGDIATRVPIEIGPVSVSQVAIRTGLKPKDRIVISDTAMFKGAQSVLLR